MPNWSGQILRAALVVALWTTAALAGCALGGAARLADGQSSESHPVVTPEPESVPTELTIERVIDSAPVPPDRLRTCQLPDFPPHSLEGALNVAIGVPGVDELVFDFDATEPVAQASVAKLVTAVAALRVLGPEFRFSTRVVRGEDPGEVWLVGGGDVTLTRAPGANYYDSVASLDQLAIQAQQMSVAEGTTITSVRADSTRYQAFPQWDESWRPGSARLGYIAPVTALQVDADRDVPGVRLSPRSTDPTGRAMQWFAQSLGGISGQTPAILPPGTAPQGAVIAEVTSSPLRQLVAIMLVDSDNSLAEVISREVALALGEASPGAAIVVGAGFPEAYAATSVLVDGSGLSGNSALSAEAVVWLLQEIHHADDLAVVRDSLPVAATTGSLRNRFQAVAVELAGRVSAKTGSIRGTRSLAGYLESDAGDQLLFSVVISGEGVSDSSRDDIDQLLFAVASCGENLADWADR